MLRGPHGVRPSAEFDAEAGIDLTNLPAPIERAMRAGVVISGGTRWNVTTWIGSGVMLNADRQSALIVTNRHVADPEFKGPTGVISADQSESEFPTLKVTYVNRASTTARVVWVASDGVDLALLRCWCPAQGVAAQPIDPAPQVRVGGDVFAVGNPHGLRWTYTRGSVSAIRHQHAGPWDVTVIQTDTPINPGSSGGGLYDRAGNLLGINTWIADPREGQGLGFALSIKTLTAFQPPPLTKNR